MMKDVLSYLELTQLSSQLPSECTLNHCVNRLLCSPKGCSDLGSSGGCVMGGTHPEPGEVRMSWQDRNPAPDPFV